MLCGSLSDGICIHLHMIWLASLYKFVYTLFRCCHIFHLFILANISILKLSKHLLQFYLVLLLCFCLFWLRLYYHRSFYAIVHCKFNLEGFPIYSFHLCSVITFYIMNVTFSDFVHSVKTHIFVLHVLLSSYSCLCCLCYLMFLHTSHWAIYFCLFESLSNV